MKILVKNYNNIENIDYTISDNKVNFLFGISGSGKSSLGNALTSQDHDNHIPYNNQNSNPIIQVNDNNVDYTQFRIFDNNYMNNVLIEKAKGEDIYNIILGDNDNIEILKKAYKEIIEDILPIKNEVYLLKGKIETLKSDLKISYKNDGNYKTSCVINKMINNINDEKLDYAKSKNYTSSRIKWFYDGTKTDEYENDKCPFCNKKLTESKKSFIDRITVFDAKSYEKINSENGIFLDLNIQMPNWTKNKEVLRFNKEIKDNIDLLSELNDIIKYLNAVDNIDIVVSELKPLKISTNMKKYYPDISNAIFKFNNNYAIIKKQIILIKKATDKLISKNISEINNTLNLLGIQYKFVKEFVDESTKKASFIIKHYSLAENKDCTLNLSYGEKNIVGLILFLIAHKDKKCLIIDDPASSYDEYRRKVIFDMIYNLKGENTTIMVLSHDHVFAKYATYHLEKANTTSEKKLSALERKYKNFTGKIDYLETFNGAVIKNVESCDFKPINDFVLERLKELPREITYQVAINLRLLYEIKKYSGRYKKVYNYLSAILHEKSKEEIDIEMQNQNFKESDVLDIINNDLQIEYVGLSAAYLEDRKIDEFNEFEKVIFAREKCPSTKQGKIAKDELNNIVHMNLAYAICLNPYKFNYFSKFIYNYINDDLNIKI